jgi:hypothetical protein
VHPRGSNLIIGERGKGNEDVYRSQCEEEELSDCATDADAISIFSTGSFTDSESSIGSIVTEEWRSLEMTYTVELQVIVTFGDDVAYSSNEHDWRQPSIFGYVTHFLHYHHVLICVVKLESTLNLDQDFWEPTQDNVEYFGLKRARYLSAYWAVKRTEEAARVASFIAKIFYSSLLEQETRGKRLRLAWIEAPDL